MLVRIKTKSITLSLPSILLLFCSLSHAAITIGGSRIVFKEAEKQADFSVRNDADKRSYLIQSWMEKSDGSRTSDFIITPPIYLSGPISENILRIIPVEPLQGLTKERLYYLNLKAIPAVDKETIQQKNSLVVATTMKIKLFFRPSSIKVERKGSEKLLKFYRRGGALEIINPTPFWLTLSSLQVGGLQLAGVMIPPEDHALIKVANFNESNVSVKWAAINDSGGTDRGKSVIQHD